MARVITQDAWTSLIAGVNQTVVPPVGWGPVNIGHDLAVIPIDQSFTNNSFLVAMWALGFLEYPFQFLCDTIGLCDDAGNAADMSAVKNVAHIHANTTRVPGVQSKVLFVITNQFTATNNESVLSIGDPATTFLNMSVQANGLAGAPVDIIGAIAAVFSSDRRLATCQIAMEMWSRFFGNKEDYYAAHIAAAAASYDLSWNVWKRMETGQPNAIGFFQDAAGALQAPSDYKVTSWNWPTTAELQNIVFSLTKPDQYFVTDNNDPLIQKHTIRFVGALDYVALVDKAWGFFAYDNSPPNVSYALSAVNVRLRFIARAIASIFDRIFEVAGVDGNSLMRIGDAGQNVTLGESTNTWLMAYDSWNNIINKICPAISLKYRPQNGMHLANPFFQTVDEFSGISTIPISMRRKPKTELNYYIEYTYDTSYHIKKPEVNYAVVRTIPTGPLVGNMIEALQTAHITENKDYYNALRQLHSTQWVRGAFVADNPSNISGVLTNSTLTQVALYALHLANPSASIGILQTLRNISGISPTSVAVIAADAPMHDTPPSWILFWNQQVYLALNTDSTYFARFTRTSIADYTMNICPDMTTYTTVQLADSSSYMNYSSNRFKSIGTSFASETRQKRF